MTKQGDTGYLCTSSVVYPTDPSVTTVTEGEQ
jgi:hypothetical protein